MEYKYYNSEKTKLSIKIIDDSLIIIAQALPWSPKIRLLSVNSDKQDYNKYLNNDLIQYSECDEQRFKERVEEVVQLTLSYPSI